jgi:hypothetical protein
MSGLSGHCTKSLVVPELEGMLRPGGNGRRMLTEPRSVQVKYLSLSTLSIDTTPVASTMR